MGIIACVRPKAAMSIWRVGLLLGAIAAGAGLIAACSRTHPSLPWCTNFGYTGSLECAYNSLEQCMASISGMGGYCTRNPRYSVDDSGPRRSLLRLQ
jgi:hypothetical protein